MKLRKVKTMTVNHNRTALKLSLFALLLTLPAFFFLLRRPTSVKAAWWNGDWQYRKVIPITSHTAAETNEYIVISAYDASDTTKYQSDCGDVRFTKENGELLPYTVTSCGASTTFNVNFDTFPAGAQDIYIYYGNANAPNGFETTAFSTEASGYVIGTVGSEATTPGPVAWWKFDEGQGQTVNDNTAKNNGTLGANSSAASDDPTWTTEDRCVMGKCLQFDGSNDLVNVSGSIVGVQSVGFWVKSTSTTASMIALTSGARITAASGTISATGFTSPTIYVNGLVSTTLTANQWNYIEVTTGTAITANAITIGTANAAFTTGFIDDVKIYPYARTAAEVKADFSAGASVLGAQDQKDFLSDGLVGYWKMDESAANSCSGGVNDSCDSSGNVYDGAWNGNATTAVGKFGNGTTYDGTGDYTNVPTPTAIQTLTFTYAAWVKPSGSGERTVFAWDSTGGRPQVRVNSTLVFLSAGVVQIASGGTVSNDVWSHIAVSFNDTAKSYVLFVNGSQVASGTYSTGFNSLSGRSLRIGDREDTEAFNGIIDEARVYNRALSASEIRQLADWAPGPVGYWKLDEGVWDGSSGEVLDSSSTGNNCTRSGGATLINGKLGNAGNFDGVNGDLSCGGTTSLDVTTGGFTLAMWYKSTTTTVGLRVLGKVNTSSSGQPAQYHIYTFTDGKLNLKVADGTYEANATSSIVTNDGTWHHIAATWDGPTQKIHMYVDGVQRETTSAGGTLGSLSNAGSFKMGTVGTETNYFPGSLDDVKIYNYARSSQQIVEDMNAGHPTGGSPVGSQVAYWKFDEGQGTTANDNSINQNNLTLSTASWANSGKINKAWNGTGALWLSRADDADLDFANTDDFAISLWYKSDSATNPSAVEYLVNKASATVAGYAIYANTSGNLCFGIDDDTSWGPDIPSCTTTDVYDASWHHLMALRDTTSDKTYIYIDGSLKDSDSDTTTATLANSLSFYAGDRDGTDNGDEFNGDIDELKVYRASLSLDQILVDMNNGSAVKYSVGQDEAADLTDGAGNVSVLDLSFDEKSGTSTNDTSGNGNTGTLGGDGSGTDLPTWKSAGECKIGACLSFDGSDDYVDAGSGSVIDVGTAYTIEAWIRPTSVSGSFPMIVSKYTSGADRVEFYMSSTNLGMSIDSSSVGSSGTSLVANVWQHVAVSISSTTATFYINGIARGSSSVSFSGGGDAASLWIGKRNEGGGTNFFPGSIDQVRIYDYARTASQVAYDYNRGAPIGWWKLDECQGTTAYDSGNPPTGGNNGTITIGASGTEDTLGTCQTSSTAWGSGATGKYSASLSFDGSDDYVQITDTASLRFDASTADFSLFAWVKRTTTGTEYVLSKEDADNDGWRLMFNSSNQVVCSEDATDVTSTSTITNTSWHLVGCTVDRDGNGQVYIDGKADGAATAMGTDAMATTANITFGTRSYTAANYLNGQIDDVKIFNYALSAAQVRKVYNEGAAVRYGN